MGQHVFYCDGNLKKKKKGGWSRNVPLQDTVNCSCIYTCTLHGVMEIINAMPCQNSEVWRAAECHIARQLDFCYIFIQK